MSKSRMFDKVKKYYDDNRWNEANVRNAVVKGWITREEYRLITGVQYDQIPVD